MKKNPLTSTLRTRCSAILKKRLVDYVAKITADGSHMDESDVVREALVEYLNERAINSAATERALEDIVRTTAQAVREQGQSESGKSTAPKRQPPEGAARKRVRQGISSNEPEQHGSS